MIRTQPASNNPDFDAWHSGLNDDARNYRRSVWKLIDRLGEGRERFGDELFWQAVHSTGLSEGTITNYLGLFKIYPKGKRRENLPLGVHEAIRSLSEDQRATVLAVAEEHDWTREDVRARMLAFKAGDEKAWDPRWKPKRTAKVIDIAEKPTHAGVSDDKPVFDATDAGQALAGEERREVLAALSEQKLSSANQRLLSVLAELKAMRTDAAFMAALEPDGLTAAAIQIEGQWLVNVATETRHRQNAEWNKPASAHSDQSGASRSVVTPSAGRGADENPVFNPETSAKPRANTLARSDADHLGPIPSNLRRR
jgi:hypothetical protein